MTQYPAEAVLLWAMSNTNSVTIPQPPEMVSEVVARLKNLRDWGLHTVGYGIDCGHQSLVDNWFYC
jgi:hypothetical protein